jgi:predicted phage-related endonuclease
MPTIHDIAQGTPEWHALRAGKYTGSNADKLLRFGTIDYSLTEAASFGGNFYTKRGHILEEEAIEIYEAVTGEKVYRPGFVTNEKYPTCGYSPDGLTETAVIEVKCFQASKHQKLYDEDIPFKILAQINFGMLLCELREARLLIYNPDVPANLAFKIIPIKATRATTSNFKRILSGKELAHAGK